MDVHWYLLNSLPYACIYLLLEICESSTCPATDRGKTNQPKLDFPKRISGSQHPTCNTHGTVPIHCKLISWLLTTLSLNQDLLVFTLQSVFGLKFEPVKKKRFATEMRFEPTVVYAFHPPASVIHASPHVK